MDAALNLLLGMVLYPLWLIAGFLDYLLHRRTHIEDTSGERESRYHVAQFATLAIALACAVLFAKTPLVLAILVGMVLLHTWLGHADVVYAENLRRIAPLEQLVHGFLSVLPVAALGIVAAMHWPDITSLPWTLRLNESPSVWREAGVFIGSYVLLAGLPNLEEYLRTSGRLHPHAERERRHQWNALKKPLK